MIVLQGIFMNDSYVYDRFIIFDRLHIFLPGFCAN